MPRLSRPIIFFFITQLLSGCGGQNAASAPAGNVTAPVEIPVTDAAGTQLVQITGGDNMHYSGSRFTVVAGRPVRVELTNIGQQPRTVMAHNIVILQSGADAEGFALSAAEAKTENYLPAALMNQVLANAPFAGPGDTVQTTITAPAPGEYPFLCTFPGHYVAGMHGTMVVVPAK
jgi:azurin